MDVTRLTLAIDSSQVKGAKRDLDQMEQAGGRLTNQMGGLKRAIIGVGIAATSYLTFRAAVGGFRSVITAASDLEETMNKFNVVFRGMENQADEWAENLQENFNMSETSARSYLASIQDMLVPMGMAREEAGQLSNKIVKLSADIGSFNNMPTADVMRDIQSALAGQYEPLRKYGVMLSATKIQQEALNAGLANTKDELTEADKAMTAYRLILEGSADAIGDVERSQGSYAYEVRRLTANIDDLKTEIGKELLPVFSDMLQDTNQWISDNDELLKQRIPEYVESIAEGIEAMAGSLGRIQNIYSSLPDGVVGAAGVGIIGRVLTGSTPIGMAAGMIYLLNKQLETVGLNLGSIGDNISDLGEIWQATMSGEKWSEDWAENQSRAAQEIEARLNRLQDFDLQGNISGLEGIDRLTDRIEDTGAAAEGIAKSIQTMAAKTDKMGQSFDVLTPSFLQVVGDLEEQRKQLLMTEVEWEKYQRVLKSGVDPTSDRADEIRNMVDRIYEMRRAMEWDEKAGAPAGIGPEMAGEHDEEMRRILDRDKDTREGISSGWQGLVGDMENAFDGWASYYSRELNDMLWDSEFSFKRIAESFGRMITEMMIQKQMMRLSEGISSWVGGLFASEHGNVFSGGYHVEKYARGGIVDKPTIFPMANGAGLMGEAGAEAIMPLTRIGGDLGVKAQTGPQNVRIEIHNDSVQGLEVTEARSEFDAQGMIVSLWIDAYQRNKGGLRNAIGG
jgi:septation ring formation regulator EzrA